MVHHVREADVPRRSPLPQNSFARVALVSLLGAAGALVLLGVAVFGGLETTDALTEPKPAGTDLEDDLVNPITTAGRADPAVSTDDFTIEVSEVDFTTVLEVSSGLDGGTEVIEANRAWVAAWARVTATHSTIRHFPAELRMKDGTTYFECGWFDDSLAQETFSPGLPLHGAFVFEVPVDRFEEPTLVVTHAFGLDRRLGAQATVDLELTTTEATDEPATLFPPEVRTRETGEDADAAE